MPKYENSIIYKLCHQNDLENNNIYIGSTTNFRTRKNNHKFNCNNENNKKYNYPVYQFIRNNGDWSEWKMIPIEKYPCNGKEELKIRERYYIEFFKSKLNKQMPSRSQKEYIENNKDKKTQYDKKRYENNKEIILEQKKQYYKNNKEIIAEKSKEYRNANIKKIKEKHKKYYEANKEILNEKIICNNCRSEITKRCLNRHQKSNKCKNYNITIE